jgi:hypothetical protein
MAIPLWAMIAASAAQSMAKEKSDANQLRASTMTQAGQQQNSGYTRQPPVLGDVRLPDSTIQNGLGALGTTWAQMQAQTDQKSRDEMSKVYTDLAKSQIAKNNAQAGWKLTDNNFEDTASGDQEVSLPPPPQWSGPAGPIQSQGGPIREDIDPITGLPKAKPSPWNLMRSY